MLKLNRIKIGLLVIFFVVNGFFVYQYVSSMEMADNLAVSVTIDNLNINTHALPNIPREVHVFLATNTWANPSDIATTILGDDCYMLELTMYQNEVYNLWVEDGVFTVYPQDMIVDDSERTPGPMAATNLARSWLRNHNIWGRNMARIGTSRENASYDRVVTFADRLGRHAVLDSYVTVWVSDRGIRRVAGSNWLATEYERLPERVALMSLYDLLLTFADIHSHYEQIEVTRIEFGYFLGSRAPEVLEALTLPVIRIVADIGTFYMNAETGELIGEIYEEIAEIGEIEVQNGD